MRRITLLAGLALVAPALYAQGTAPAGAPQTRVPTAADSAVLRALDLPQIFQRARTAGIPDSSLRGMIDAIRRRGVPPEDVAPAVELEVEEVERGGSKDNFGSFVRAQVESGLRGRELSAAIRAERERRGMGPAGRGRPDGAGARPEKGARPDAARERDEKGRRPATVRPDSTQRPSGRPATAPRGGRTDTTARAKAPATPTTRRP
jgi:hypothetical protein